MVRSRRDLRAGYDDNDIKGKYLFSPDDCSLTWIRLRRWKEVCWLKKKKYMKNPTKATKRRFNRDYILLKNRKRKKHRAVTPLIFISTFTPKYEGFFPNDDCTSPMICLYVCLLLSFSTYCKWEVGNVFILKRSRYWSMWFKVKSFITPSTVITATEGKCFW